jgi:hypothetical protein
MGAHSVVIDKQPVSNGMDVLALILVIAHEQARWAHQVEGSEETRSENRLTGKGVRLKAEEKEG